MKYLIAKEKPIIAPLLIAVPECNDLYSNFFYDIDSDGYYKSHEKYTEILTRNIVGTFKVPVVHCTYLIDTRYLDKLSYADSTKDYEFVIFSRCARNNSVDQYICNEKTFGELIHFYDDLTLDQEVRKVKDYFRRFYAQ